MATIDLTLDALKIPNINGTFPFGKKITQTELNHGGLSTTEVNSNVMLPFTQMRPKICDEDSDTSPVEYDAKVVFNAPQGTTPAAGYTLTMGNGTYVGCTVTYTNLMEYACTVKQSDGTTTLFEVPAGKTMSAMWNGTAWLWTTTGSVTANDPTPVSSAAVHAAIGGKQPKCWYDSVTQIGSTWKTSYQDGSGTQNFVLPDDGLYKFVAQLTNSKDKNTNEVIFQNSNDVYIWYVSYNYFQTVREEIIVPLRAQTVKCTHSATGGNSADGRAVVEVYRVLTD